MENQTRLEAAHEAPAAGRKPARKRFAKCCIECGERFECARAEAQFCGNACRQLFNNRRMQRGAVLYDLFMINRNERGFAKVKRVLFTMTRLAMYWREEDQRERAGRRSWQKPEEAVQAAAWANATVVNRNAAGNK
jgi:hypothetical protein